MRTKTLVEVAVELESLTCCECGMTFGVPTSVVQQYRRDHRNFYCPSGHGQHFTGETEEERLRAKLKAQEAATKQAEYAAFQERKAYKEAEQRHELTRRSLSATRGQVTRIKNRIANGVCPVCSRSFENLHRHMHGQHPEYTSEAGS